MASKAALVSYTRASAMELAPRGILVNAIAPGLIDTPLLRNLSPERLAAQLALQPTGRAGQPQDIANAVSFLAAPHGLHHRPGHFRGRRQIAGRIGSMSSMEGIKWDLEVDALVVGSGAGGMAAALTAREEGLDVLLVEKTDRIGGSTAISGGALWIPLNAQSEGAGHPDTFEQVWTYLQQTVGAASSDAMKRAYLEAGPRMMDYLVERGHLQVAARTSPDYYPDRPGAAMGGRSLDPVEFDGRKLGAKFRELRDPLKEFTVLGGMMVNITDVRHLLRATRSFTAWRHSMKLVLRYAADRLGGRHRGTRLLLGNALAAQLFHGLIRRGIPYWLNTAARTASRRQWPRAGAGRDARARR